MGIIAVKADPNDGDIRSSGTWSDTGAEPYQRKIRQGHTITMENDPALGKHLITGGFGYGPHPPGAAGSGGMRGQSFVEFAPGAGLVLPGDSDLITAAVRTTRYGYEASDPNNWGGDDSLQFWNRPDVNLPPTTSSWVDLNYLGQNFDPDFEYFHLFTMRKGQTYYYPTNPEPEFLEAGGEKFMDVIADRLAAGQSYKALLTTYTSLYDYPGSYSWVMWLTSSSGDVPTKQKPHLVLRTQKRHDLDKVGGSSIQMTDGTAVFLKYDRANNAINLYYQRVGQTGATLIRKIPTTSAEHANFYSLSSGFQTFGLTRDASNNLFIVGMKGALTPGGIHVHENFCVNGFKYNGNYSWQYYTPTTMGENTLSSVYTHRGVPNNFAPVWVPNSDKGSGGQLVVLHSRRDGQWGWYQFGVSALYAPWLIGSGGPGKNHASLYADPPQPHPNGAWRPVNSTASGLDAVLGPNATNKVFFSSFYSALPESEVERAGQGSFLQSSAHATADIFFKTPLANAPHDPDSKQRQVWMGETSAYYASMISGTLLIRRVSGDTLYRSIDFTTLGITNFPSKATMESNQGWDIIWDNLRNKFWIWYVDSQNNRLIRKVGYDHINNTLDTSTQFTPAVLGASGDRIIALRAPRQATDVRAVLLDAALVNGLGVPQGVVTLRDLTMNAAPLAPTIDTVASFNATTAKAITYAFNDPGDVPTAHDMEIKRVSTGATIYTSGKVAPVANGIKWQQTVPANTLTNDTQYQVRVRNYDSVDVVGAWSDWKSFSTSGTGGTVVITDPVADMMPLNKSSVIVAWSYSNTIQGRVQNGYQIRVYNDVTNALFSDTGIVSSTATNRTLTGFLTDVRYRIEVQVRDTSGALSGAGIRIIYPDFDNPSIPVLDIDQMPGYIEVRCTNPPPTGDNPVPVANQIARKLSTDPDSAYVIVGTCPINGVFRDYTVASKVAYSYKARSTT